MKKLMKAMSLAVLGMALVACGKQTTSEPKVSSAEQQERKPTKAQFLLAYCLMDGRVAIEAVNASRTNVDFNQFFRALERKYSDILSTATSDEDRQFVELMHTVWVDTAKQAYFKWANYADTAESIATMKYESCVKRMEKVANVTIPRQRLPWE